MKASLTVFFEDPFWVGVFERIELTVFFEEPFWVGVFERIEDGKLSVCKVTFGAEPKDYDVWDMMCGITYYTTTMNWSLVRPSKRKPGRRLIIRKEGSEMPESIWRTPASVRNPSRLCKDSGRK